MFGRNVVRMSSGEKDIVLDQTRSATYYNCNKYDPSITISRDYWIEINVHHEGRYKKNEILVQFIKYFSGIECYPVAYKSLGTYDMFYTRLTQSEAKMLFTNNLKMVMHDGKIVYLTVKLNVAKYEVGQITAESKITEVLKNAIQNKAIVGNYKLIRLNNFSDKPILKDIFISLTNENTFKLFCEILTKLMSKDNITGMKLQHNNIKTLRPLELLKVSSMEYIDLSSNEIESTDDLQYLSGLGLKELNLTNNPLTRLKNYDYKVREFLPDLRILDTKDRIQKEIVPIFKEQSSGDLITKNDLKGLNLGKYRASPRWHQVSIHHGKKYNKEQILKALFNLTENQGFYPTYYKESETTDIFFVRNCLDAIETLCQNGLTLTVKENTEPIPITLCMNALSFKRGEGDTPAAVMDCLIERYNIMDKTLNLDDFAKSLLAKDIIICMSNSKALTMVLTLAGRKYVNNLFQISLQHNNIRTSKGFIPILSMKSLKCLNLAHNDIENWSEFSDSIMNNSSITEIHLEGNPFCKTFKNTFEYIRAVLYLFPELEKLDGHTLLEKKFLWHKNYVCDLAYYDLVQYFIIQYFNLFDSVQRLSIKEMYHPNACMTLSINFDKAKITLANAQKINRYIAISRNIFKISNIAQSHINCIMGREAILHFLAELPPTEHDFNNFSIDVLHASSNMIVITINGLFKEMGDNLLENEQWLGFVRTFILRPVQTGLGLFKSTNEYQIFNDQINIFSLTVNQVKNGFLQKNNDIEMKPAIEYSDEEKNHLVKIFQDITNMKPNWSIKCLSKYNWVFTDAVENFAKLYEQDKIPSIGFMDSTVDVLSETL